MYILYENNLFDLCIFPATLKLINLNVVKQISNNCIISAAALKLNTALKELYLGENYLMQNDASQLSALLKVNSVLQLLDIR